MHEEKTTCKVFEIGEGRKDSAGLMPFGEIEAGSESRE